MDGQAIFTPDLHPALAAAGSAVIYGAGANACKLLFRLGRRAPGLRVFCLADADAAKRGLSLGGAPVVSPESLSRHAPETCVMVTPDQHWLAITETLERLGFRNLFFLNPANAALSSLLSSAGPLILGGAGANARRLLARLGRQTSGPQVLCLADADAAKQGRSLGEAPIVPLESLSRHDPGIRVLITPDRGALAMAEDLARLGFHNLFFLNSRKADAFRLGQAMARARLENRAAGASPPDEDSESAGQVRESLADAKSREVFDACLRSRRRGGHAALESLREDDQYFPGDLVALGEDEVFVDCGAFNGDTIRAFANRAGTYQYIHAFEPDPWLYELTKARVAFEKLERCEVRCLAVSDRGGELRFSPDGEAGRLDGNGEIMVRAASLDDLLRDHPHRPTLIKMDIEGAEPEALRGAREIIARDRPRLAVCVYHHDAHLLEIPRFLKAEFPDYRLFLRHHGDLHETVCYAMPAGRAP